MNRSKRLSFLLASSIIGLPLCAKESTPQLKNRVIAAALLTIIDHADEIENVLVTTFNSLPPAEQQQIITTLLNIFMTILQNSQTTPAQTTTTTQTTSPSTTAQPTITISI